ncbi:putative membrane protein [Methylopila capsulata]|uniref:Membrane protein n=1 Tax=Methylopila capsulata TaxID=61654 RepID=A0A9W6IU82_9HYPH|nr:putative membrane protein [Methylopila capsulata]GLK55717.1 membrane protein [Methylopila capsulata]
MASGFYRSQIGAMLAPEPNMVAAAGFYALYVIGIVLFAVTPGLVAGSWTTALLWGALFGFFCYATYDFTNLATLKDWPATVTIVDLSWGTTLTGAAAVAGFFAARLVGGEG